VNGGIENAVQPENAVFFVVLVFVAGAARDFDEGEHVALMRLDCHLDRFLLYVIGVGTTSWLV
jgi:hypothetical protein